MSDIILPKTVIARLKAFAEAADPKALVVPHWIPVKDGDNADELRSALDENPETSAGRIRCIMIEDTAPATRADSVKQVPYDLLDEEPDSAHPRAYDLEWTFKVGVYVEYQRTADAEESTADVARGVFEALADQLASHRKLGLSFVINHSDLQLAGSYLHEFDQDLAHVRVGIVSVKLVKSLPAA